MTHSDSSDPEIVDATNDLIAAGRLLEAKGIGRTKIYDILRQNLPESSYKQRLNETAVKHIRMMREVLKGRHAADVRAENGLSYAGRKAVLHDGARKICRTLDMNGRWLFEQPPLREANTEFWLAQADKAEQILVDKINDSKGEA